MMIPFFFTSYKKAPLATCMSFLSSMNYLFAAFFVVGYIMNWSGARADMTLGTSILAGGVFGLVHAFASVTCKADQTVCGIAMNLVGPGLALFLSRVFFEGATQTKPVTNKIPKLFGSRGLPGSLNNLNVDVTTLLALIVTILMIWIFYKTTWGLHLRAVGEHPAAADTLGINVYRVRYICVIISGVLAGFGGAAMTLAIARDRSAVHAHGDQRPGLYRDRGGHLR